MYRLRMNCLSIIIMSICSHTIRFEYAIAGGTSFMEDIGRAHSLPIRFHRSICQLFGTCLCSVQSINGSWHVAVICYLHSQLSVPTQPLIMSCNLSIITELRVCVKRAATMRDDWSGENTHNVEHVFNYEHREYYQQMCFLYLFLIKLHFV